MLKIQLCPETELEDRYWWKADAAALIGVGLVAWIGSVATLEAIKSETDRLNVTAAEWNRQYSEVKPLVEKFKNLDNEVDLLNRKVDALRRITVSRIEKILPVVIVEQLQTLRPEGLWYHSIKYNEDKKISIKGATRDSLLISEFLLGIRETMNPETVTSDVRTQFGFNKIRVKEIKDAPTDPGFIDLESVLTFETSAEIQEKQKAVVETSVASPSGRSARSTWF